MIWKCFYTVHHGENAGKNQECALITLFIRMTCAAGKQHFHK